MLLRFCLFRDRYTLGFKSPLHRADHFKRHRTRLQIPDGKLYERIYERIADRFLGLPKSSNAVEFSRPWNDDLFRYDKKRNVMGILDRNTYIKTYFRPDPSKHGLATNMDYFNSERAKTT